MGLCNEIPAINLLPLWVVGCGLNSLWPGDAIWRNRSGSTLGQVMASTCCLTAPSHHLSHCWLIVSEVLWYSLASNFTIYLSILGFIVCTTMFCRLYNQPPWWSMGLFTRSHRIPPATVSIQCLETHDHSHDQFRIVVFAWMCVCCSGGKCA